MSDISESGMATLNLVEVGRADEIQEIEIQSSSSPSVKIASDRKSLCVAVTKDVDLCIDIRLPEQVNAINLQSQIQIVGGK